jgi:hypothetical protein
VIVLHCSQSYTYSVKLTYTNRTSKICSCGHVRVDDIVVGTVDPKLFDRTSRMYSVSDQSPELSTDIRISVY